MNTVWIIRIAKIAALFCFVLPWFMVSCAGTPIPGSNIAGYELITGHSQASAQMAQQMGGGAAQSSGSITGGNIMYQLPFIIAAAAIGLGLLLSFTLRGAAAGRAALITSGGALAAVIAGYLLLQNAIKSGMGQASSSMGAQSPFGSTGGGDFAQFNTQMNQMSQALLANIDLQPQMGYWLTIVCLVIAGVFSFLLMRGQDMLGAGAPMSFAPAAAGGARTPDAIAWESMNQFDTDQLADFLMKHPGSRFAATAQANLARISAGGGTAPDADSDMWGRIDQNNVDQLADYLMKFPGGRFARTAQAKMQALSAPPAAIGAAPPPSAAPAPPTPMMAAPPSYSDAARYPEPARKGPNLVVVVAIAAVVLGGAVAGGYVWWQSQEKARVEAEAKAAADQAAAQAQAQAAALQARIDACTAAAPDGSLDAAVNACVSLLWDADPAARDPAVAHVNQVAAAVALAARQRIDEVPEIAEAAFYVDRGVCPGEGCLYGMWTATQQTPLYASPTDPRVVGSIEANERVLAATGEVHTLPIRGRVSQAFEGHNVGDAVILLTDMGEGTFRIWHNGAVAWSTQSINILCDPAAGPDCRRPFDFGESPQQQSVWWVQVRRQNGETGWVRDAANFTGKSRYE